jgi:chromosome segregation ATPase
MSRSSFLSKLVLSGSLLLSTALVSPHAMAQKGTVLNPSTEWAISKIEGQSDGQGYCALARRFNQNTILTFAQNATNELSFALDFQRARFSTEQSIDIVLDAGAGEVREFDVTPVSNKAFVVRLGRDKSFLRALKKTGYLRAEIDGYVYGFNLVDIDDGRRDLEDCVDEQLEPQTASLFGSGSSTQDVPSVSATNNMALAAMDIKVNSLKEENDRIEEARVNLERENHALRMEQKRREIQLTGELDSLKRNIDRMERDNERLENELATIESEKGLEIEKALGKLRASSDIITDYEIRNEDLQGRLEKTKKEYDILQKSLQAAEQKNTIYGKDIESLKNDYTKQIDDLRADLQTQREKNTALNEEIRTVQTEVRNTKKVADKDIADTQALLREYEEKTAALLLKLEQKEKNHEATLAELEALEKGTDDLSHTHKTKIEELKSKYAREISELKEALSDQKAKNQDLTANLDGAKAEAQKTQKAVTADLTKAEKLLQDYEAKTEDLSEKLKQKEKDHDAVLAQLDAIEDEAASLRSTSSQKEQKQLEDIKALKHDLAELKQENNELNLALKAHKESEKHNISLAQAAENEAQKALKKIQVDQEAILDQLETAEKQNVGLMASLAHAEENNKNLQTRIDDITAAHKAEKQTLMADIKALRNDKLELAAKLDQTDSNNSAALEKSMKANIALEDRLAALETEYKGQVRTLEQNLQAETAKNKALKDTLETKQADLSQSTGEMQKAMAVLKAENAALKSKTEAQTAENATLKTALSDIKAQYKTLQSRIGQTDEMHAAELSEFKEKIALLEQERDSLKKALKNNPDKSVEYAKALEQNAALKEKLASAEGRFKTQIQEYEMQIEDLKQAQSTISQDNEDSFKTAELNRLKADNKILHENLNAVEQRYAAQIQDLKSQLDLSETNLKILKESPKIDDNTKAVATLKAQNEALEHELHEVKTARLKAQSQEEVRLKNLALQANQTQKNDKLKDIEKAYETSQSRITFLENQLARTNNEKRDALEQVNALEGKLARTKKIKTQATPTPNKPSFLQRLAGKTTTASVDTGKQVVKAGKELVVSSTTAAALTEKVKTPHILAEPVKKTAMPTLPPSPRKLDLLSGKIIDEQAPIVVTPDAPVAQSPVSVTEKHVPKVIPPVKAKPVVKNHSAAAPYADLKTARSGIYTQKQIKVLSDAQKMEESLKAETKSVKTAPAPPVSKEPKITVRKASVAKPDPVKSDIAKSKAAKPADVPLIAPDVIKQTPPKPAMQPSTPDVPAHPEYVPAFDLRPLIVQTGGSPSLIAIRRLSEKTKNKAVYQWENNQIYGSIEQSPMADSREFEGRIQRYLEQTESRCAGDFAIMPDTSEQFGATRVDSYDIACVGSDISSSASLLFVKKDKTFSVIAHESATNNMETAMSLRERLIKLITGS